MTTTTQLMIEVTDLIRQGIMRSEDSNDATPAIVIALRKLKRQGVNPDEIVVLDVKNETNMRSMTKLYNDAAFLAAEYLKKIKSLEVQLEETRKQRSNGISWEEIQRTRAARAWLSGKKPKDIAETMSLELGKPITENMLRQQFYNSPPPEGLKAVVHKHGETDWSELWLLGSVLREGTTEDGKRERGWQTALEREIGKIPKFGQPLLTINMEKLQILRDNYHKMAGSKERGQISSTIIETVKSAGTEGISKKELLESGLDLRRINDIRNQKKIFNISNNEEEQWFVHISYSKNYEKEFQREMERSV